MVYSLPGSELLSFQRLCPAGSGTEHKRHKREHKKHKKSRGHVLFVPFVSFCASCVPFPHLLGKAPLALTWDERHLPSNRLRPAERRCPTTRGTGRVRWGASNSGRLPGVRR